ncbi:MAG: PQQ-dependent sugar dehydrogenase [Phycisphaerales bacterium]|jgi:glucose/arabinose dehydrogenase|nr:PQQ-dependent sugar dehydrogenase [Phycisphaerales bacterium]
MNHTLRSGALACSLLVAAHAAAQNVDALWTGSCASCHGDKAQGKTAASLLTKEKRDLSLLRPFFDTIKNGAPGVENHAFAAGASALDDKQLWALVAYIREQQENARYNAGEVAKAKDGVFTSQHHRYRMERFVKDGLDTPWAIAFLPDGRMLITNRSGKLVATKDGKTLATVQGTPSVVNDGQGGLMDVALHPEYAQNGWVYLSFQHGEPKKKGMTKLVRGKIAGEGDSLTWTDEQVTFEAKPEHYLAAGGVHFGSRTVFQKHADGKWCVFFSHGERGRMEMAQDVTRPNGKIHRLYDDGTIPADNPFVDNPRAYHSIWSFGHRNPQGLVFDLDGRLWDTEHGPRGGDELNLVEKGRNYGWPLVSFGINYSGDPFRTPWPDLASADVQAKNIAMPTFVWLPSIGACGLDVSTGGAFPNWKGDLFAGGLSGGNVDRIRVRDGKVVEREEILKNVGRVRDVRVAPDGTIYVVLNQADIVVRLVNADSK